MPPAHPPPSGAPPAAPARQPYWAGPMPPATSAWAAASLICAFLGYVGVPVLGSLLAVIFGHLALREIRRSGGQIVGTGYARAGLILGYIALALAAVLLLVVFWLRGRHSVVR